MCSDTGRLEMLIVLHVCSFLMSYDSGDKNLVDIETIALSCNQSRKICCDLTLDKFDFHLYYSSSDGSYIAFHSHLLRIL